MGALGEVPLLAGPRPAILALADGGRRRVFAMNQRKKEQTILRKGDLGGRLLLRDVPRYFRARLGHNSTAGRGRHGEAVRERDPGSIEEQISASSNGEFPRSGKRINMAGYLFDHFA
jgi:hypothetical protein